MSARYDWDDMCCGGAHGIRQCVLYAVSGSVCLGVGVVDLGGTFSVFMCCNSYDNDDGKTNCDRLRK